MPSVDYLTDQEKADLQTVSKSRDGSSHTNWERVMNANGEFFAGLMSNISLPSLQDEALTGFEPPSMISLLMHHTFIIFFTLLGNMMLVFVIFANNRAVRRKKVTPVQMLMLHMCAADVLFALITIAPAMWLTITVPHFYGPDIFCRIVKYLQVLPMYASSFLLVAISADRFMAICRPLASMRSSSAYSRPALFASLAWGAALLFCTPQLFLFKKSNGEDGECGSDYTSQHQYTIYVIVFNAVVWLLPSAIAGYLYYRVCVAVWRSAQGVHQKSTQSQDQPSQIKLQAGNNVQNVELDRRRIQTVKLTLTIVAANFILWAPFCITSVVDAICPECINPVFATYMLYFGNLNSCMNPWIWFYFNRGQIRRALRCHSLHQPLLGSVSRASSEERFRRREQVDYNTETAQTQQSNI